MTENNIKSPVKESENPCENLGLDCRMLQIGETKYRTLLTKKYVNRKVYKPANPKMIYSYIPGTILEIFVKEGKELEAGQPVLILEAMKMRNIVTIPVSGKIKKINVKPGETIPKNFLIAEIE